MALQITITDAGRAEIINAQNTGTGPVVITEIGFGSAQYVPTNTQTALQAETKRVSTIAGQAVADDIIHVTVKDESSDAYNVGEFGLYTDSGTLFAVYSQAAGSGWIIEKAAPSALLLAVDVVLGTLDANSIMFGDVSFINPPATETVAGVVELATDVETKAGTDQVRATTPAGVAAVMVEHGAEEDPHSQYLKEADFKPLEFGRRIDLSDQVQTLNYRKSVIALCEVTNTNPNLDSFSAGQLVFHRSNGTHGAVCLQFVIEKRYNTEAPNFSGLAMSANGYADKIRPCTFVYGGVKYAGVEFHFNDAEHNQVVFHGETSFGIFGLDYYNKNGDEVLNAEVNDSLDYAGVTLGNDLYLNNKKVWNAGNGGAGSDMDAGLLEGLRAGQFLRSDTNTFLNAYLRGGFGAQTTGGTLDWNDITNARSGNGHTLLNGMDANGPGVPGYYHAFCFEYGSKDGSGNLTQLAIPYSAADTIHFRTRYLGAWGTWNRVLDAASMGAGGGIDVDMVHGMEPSSANIPSSLMSRNSAGDVFARFLRSEYAAAVTTCAYFMGQSEVGAGSGANNHVRPMSLPTMLASLGMTGVSNAQGRIKIPFEESGGAKTLLVQWGTTGAISANSGLTVTFGAAYTELYVVIPIAVVSTDAADAAVNLRSPTANNFRIANGWAAVDSVKWLAVGLL